MSATYLHKLGAYAHTEPLRKAGPDGSTAGVNIRSVTSVQTNAALPTTATPRTTNADGKDTKPQAGAIISKPGPTVTSGTGAVIERRVGADLASIPTTPQSDASGNFVAVKDLAEISGLLAPGDIERLGNYGISVGVRNGLLSIKREYVPAAVGIILQAR
jgi:hypothetical protein